MKKQINRKQSGKVRKNRRVRERFSPAEFWEQHREGWINGFTRTTGGILRRGAILRAMWTQLTVKLQVEQRFRRFFIGIGRRSRKHCFPLVQRQFTRGLKKLQQAAARENRAALKQGIRAVFNAFGWLVINSPRGLRQFAHFLKNEKGSRLKTIARFFNPARVRMEAVAEYRRHTGVITGLMVGGTVLGILLSVIATIAVFGGNDDNDATADAIGALAENDVHPGIGAGVGESDPLAKGNETTAAQADFYNPFYVFTNTGAKAVSAYPLADPPGIVVDVHGVRKSDASPEEMVGKDDRVVGVRRLVTSKGLRYIIRTSQSIKRIKSQMDGNIITVSPLS